MTMVEKRFMSLLSTFPDDELDRGLREIGDSLAAAEVVRFTDSFEFILGRNKS
ncbi:hypothetical protein C6A86_023525 [Mycobacterium sp. ITM-2016-00316]|uniref:hypothetical protein n=1 Tax=Mycobacterium sp. ITM-2016-00316 TaxID=2099695 RepID=UPI001304CAEE|nr:hypothetical protein [Mycobacterium sp. ITM-2016-00316]WNG81132.1 hypothetical protein C6A86_023525 [Mycobacterium sp. ITM-2016-00316]